jgi:CPA1 family monovalent cation:H+ antiporter
VFSAATRSQVGAVWQVGGFILESLIFVLIGLSLRGVLSRLGGWHASETRLPAALATIAAVIVSRFLWIIPSVYIPRALIPSLRRVDPYPPFAVPIVMSWAGMRGVVSLAAALALPQVFPGRDFILATTFAVILVTVLVQGSTLGPLIRALKVGSFTTITRGNTIAEDQARARMAAAQLAEVEKRSLRDDKTHRHPRLVEQYTYRANASLRFSEAAGGLIEAKRDHFSVVLAAIYAGRAEILKLHREGVIHDSVLHSLEHDLDLEEMTAQRHFGEP